ncbi:hypothetical protein KEM54_001305 [Ascosphaera aggregata]|nr:hypothetical protein KEM54_001305 [Ascosphaera aggregata]
MDPLYEMLRGDRRTTLGQQPQGQLSDSSIGREPDMGQGAPQTVDPSSRNLSLDGLDSMLQNELMHIILSSPPIYPDSELRLMTTDYVVKYIPIVGCYVESHFTKVQEVADRLQIKIPRLRKLVENRAGHAYVIMDRVRGKSLEEIWNDLSWSESISIARKLRVLIKKLRSVTYNRAGALISGSCQSPFVRRAGLQPFPSCIMVMEHLFFWKVYGTQYKDTGVENRRYGFQKIKNFVFTHQHLTPSHIMVDEQGDVVLVNWLEAGYYPKHFESTMMYHWRELQGKEPKHHWGPGANLRWKWLCRWAAGYDSHEANFLLKIREKIQQAPSRGGREDYLLLE